MVAALIPTPRSRCTSSRPRPRYKPTTRKRSGGDGRPLRFGEAIGVVRPASFDFCAGCGLDRRIPAFLVAGGGRHAVRAAALRRSTYRALGDSGTVERAEARRARAPPTLLSGGEIADELTVAVNTATSHVRSIDRKLGISLGATRSGWPRSAGSSRRGPRRTCPSSRMRRCAAYAVTSSQCALSKLLSRSSLRHTVEMTSSCSR